MIRIRPSRERGQTNLDWLDSRHTFSFNDYYDPEHNHFRKLRVINEDRVIPGGGFGTHPHHDMEIITYVLEGALEHKDSLGTGSVIRAGDVQRMTAGSGITHSEFNHSKTDPVHFLQIWIFPDKKGLTPSYQQESLTYDGRRNELLLLASKDAADGVVCVNQDIRLFGAFLQARHKLKHGIGPQRHVWIQVARGEGFVSGERVEAGDGVAVSDESLVEIEADASIELLLFDLA